MFFYNLQRIFSFRHISVLNLVVPCCNLKEILATSRESGMNEFFMRGTSENKFSVQEPLDVFVFKTACIHT